MIVHVQEAASVLQMLQLARGLQTDEGPPMVVHCSAGCGRTGISIRAPATRRPESWYCCWEDQVFHSFPWELFKPGPCSMFHGNVKITGPPCCSSVTEIDVYLIYSVTRSVSHPNRHGPSLIQCHTRTPTGTVASIDLLWTLLRQDRLAAHLDVFHTVARLRQQRLVRMAV